MALLLIPLDYSLPTLQRYLKERGDSPLDSMGTQIVTDLLERGCVRTGEALVTFALRLGGRPCLQ